MRLNFGRDSNCLYGSFFLPVAWFRKKVYLIFSRLMPN